MSDISTTSWSEVDGSNNQTPPDGWPSVTMLPNQVEPTARAGMGATKRWYNRINPTYAATQSTADAYVWSPSQAITGYNLYERIRLRMGIANASTSPTLAGSSLPPQPLRKMVASSITVLAAGDIRAKDHEFYWDGGQYILVDPYAEPATGTVTSVGGDGDTSSGILVSGSPITGAGTLGLKIDPSRLTAKASPTSSDTMVIGDGAASSAVKGSNLSALNSVVRPGIPPRTVTGNTTTIMADVNGSIYHPVGATAGTITFAANSDVAFPIGTAISIANEPGAGPLTLTMATSDTLVSASTGATGTRTLATPGMATALKVTATRWMISGTGLS